LPLEIYALVGTHKVAKDLWERIQMLMHGTSLTKQERECKLYDAFDKFAYQKGETFSLLLNDMNMYNMKLEQFQVNTKFLNTLPPEWNEQANLSTSSAVLSPTQFRPALQKKKICYEFGYKMASEQRSSGPVLNEMTPGTISSGLVPTTSPSTSYVPPSRNDWDLLFQPMFDELLNPPPSVVNQILKLLLLLLK
nr:hypothetical protein [Tanacetum cinerariifolium]